MVLVQAHKPQVKQAVQVAVVEEVLTQVEVELLIKVMQVVQVAQVVVVIMHLLAVAAVQMQ